MPATSAMHPKIFKEMRRALGYSIEKYATLVGLKPSTIEKFECGQRPILQKHAKRMEEDFDTMYRRVRYLGARLTVDETALESINITDSERVWAMALARFINTQNYIARRP